MLPVLAFPAFPHAIALPALSMTNLSARTILSRASRTYKSGGPNKGAIAGGVIAAIAIVALAAFAFYYLRGRGRRASSPGFIIDPASNEAGVQRVMNAQLQPNKEFMKGPSDGGTLDLSTMPVLPTSPMKVYNPNNAATLPEPQDDQYPKSVSPRAAYGQYQGTENMNPPALANAHAPWSQGHNGQPTSPDPRYDLYARSVSQESFGQYQGTGNTSRQTDVQAQVSRQRTRGGMPTLPEPQDESYSPTVAPKVIFGQTGAENILPNTRASRPLGGYSGLPIV